MGITPTHSPQALGTAVLAARHRLGLTWHVNLIAPDFIAATASIHWARARFDS